MKTPRHMRFARKALRRAKEKLNGASRGQAIVLIAFAMVGLIAATGLALDGATVFTRRADLRRAVDSAALAGVVELDDGDADDEGDADLKAVEVMGGNGIEVPAANVGTESVDCDPDQTCMYSETPSSEQLGAYRYYVEGSMPVELAFLNIVGFSRVRVQAEALAEYNPLADLYASQTLESGVVKTSVQSLFGPDICHDYGDPYTPTTSPWWGDLEGTYHYRVRIPRSFVESYDTLRVELMDPDSYNAADAMITVTHEDMSTENINISGEDRRDGWLIDIDDGLSPNNDFWFHRIDEIRGTGTVGECGEPGSYDPETGTNSDRETSIQFELSYYETQSDGSVVRRALAQYTSPRSAEDAPPTGHPTANQHCTDLTWVSPGAAQGSDYDSATCPQGVPEDGDAESAFAYTPDVGDGTFEIDLPTIDYDNNTCSGGEMPDCYLDPISEDIFVYLDVSGVAGASENGFELWAGPDLSVYDVPTNLNDRNVYVVTNGGEDAHSSEGVVVSALGNLPLNSNTSNTVDIPLMYVGPQLAGSTINVSLYDPDSGSVGPVTFFFDTVPFDASDLAGSDWYDDNCGTDIPLGSNWVDECTFVVPSESDPTNPIVFVGGILNAHYQAGFQDTYVWRISVETRPYLVE